jgi:membrane protease YdiL (CAAX protease family)
LDRLDSFFTRWWDSRHDANAFSAKASGLACSRFVSVSCAPASYGNGDAITERRIASPKVVGSGQSYSLLAIVEFGYAFFVGGGVSEEPGWRGFLLPRLQERFNPLMASLLVWIPWALWHAPLDFAGYAGSTFATYLRTRVFILVPLSIIITWVYNRCGKTILSAALFHSAFNVAPDFVPSAEWAG